MEDNQEAVVVVAIVVVVVVVSYSFVKFGKFNNLIMISSDAFNFAIRSPLFVIRNHSCNVVTPIMPYFFRSAYL